MLSDDLACAPASDALVIAQWPEGLEKFIDETIENQIELIQQPVRAFREIKNKYNIKPSARPITTAKGPADIVGVLNENADLICQLSAVKSFSAAAEIEKPANAAVTVLKGISFYMHDVIDPEAERQRLQKQKNQIAAALKPIEAKLNNDNFVNRAKAEVVEQARQRQKELAEQLATIDEHINLLG